MALGLLGRKIGMTQVNTENDERLPVTVIEVGPCLIMQKKTLEKDGYTAVKLAFGERKTKRTPNAQRKEFEKLQSTPKRFIREFRVNAEDLGKFEEGKTIGIAEVFQKGQLIDVRAKTKGRGYTGVMKRWNFKGNRASHGTHEFFRHGGSIGSNTWPGRVMKGKKMPGQYGNKPITTQNLEIVRIMNEENCVLVHGTVPGANNGFVELRPSSTKPAPAKK